MRGSRFTVFHDKTRPIRVLDSPEKPARRLRAIQLLHTAVEDPDGFGPGFEITCVRLDGPGVEGGFYSFGSVLSHVGKLTRWRAKLGA